MLVKQNGGAKLAVVELAKEDNGSHYGVSSAFIAPPKYPANGERKLIWERSGNPFDKTEPLAPLIYPTPTASQGVELGARGQSNLLTDDIVSNSDMAVNLPKGDSPATTMPDGFKVTPDVRKQLVDVAGLSKQDAMKLAKDPQKAWDTLQAAKGAEKPQPTEQAGVTQPLPETPPAPEKIDRGLKDLGYGDADRAAMTDGRKYHIYDNTILKTPVTKHPEFLSNTEVEQQAAADTARKDALSLISAHNIPMDSNLAQDILKSHLKTAYRESRDVDPVTGFQVPTAYKSATERAWESHVKDERQFAYGDIDVLNLGGLNKAAGSNAAADVHLSAMAQIIKDTVNKSIPKAQVFRQGGDEFSVLAPDIDKKQLQIVLDRAKLNVDAYVKENGLDTLYHPKLHKETGTGIYYGVANFKDGGSFFEAKKAADEITAQAKRELEKGGEDVTGSKIAEAGAISSDKQAGRVGQSAQGTHSAEPEAQRGIRPEAPAPEAQRAIAEGQPPSEVSTNKTTENQPPITPPESTGISFSIGRDDAILKTLKDNAAPFRELKLTPETWKSEFGENQTVKTPVGDVTLGRNQYIKLKAKSREKYFGLIKPTLTDPLYVVEVHDPKEGAERDTKRIYIKPFVDENKNTYFTSITIQKDGKEISISSHPKESEVLIKSIKKGEVLYSTSAREIYTAAPMLHEHPPTAGRPLDESTSNIPQEGESVKNDAIKGSGEETQFSDRDKSKLALSEEDKKLGKVIFGKDGFFDKVQKGEVRGNDLVSLISIHGNSQEKEIAKAMLLNPYIVKQLEQTIIQSMPSTSPFVFESGGLHTFGNPNKIELNFFGLRGKYGGSSIKKLMTAGLHEIIHDATSKYLYISGDDTIYKIRQAIKDNHLDESKNKYYGMKNDHEFLAEAFTNKEFQDFLKSIPDEGAPVKQKTTLWDKFVNFVKNALGLKDSQWNMLDKVIEEGTRIIQKQAEREYDNSVSFSISKKTTTTGITDKEMSEIRGKTKSPEVIKFIEEHRHSIEKEPARVTGNYQEVFFNEFGLFGKTTSEITTPIETVTIMKKHYLKLAAHEDKSRKDFVNFIRPTLERPNDIRDVDGEHTYIKIFKDGGIKLHATIVKVKPDGTFYVTNIPLSNIRRWETNLLKGESILPDALKGSLPVSTAPSASLKDTIAASDIPKPAKEAVPSSPDNYILPQPTESVNTGLSRADILRANRDKVVVAWSRALNALGNNKYLHIDAGLDLPETLTKETMTEAQKEGLRAHGLEPDELTDKELAELSVHGSTQVFKLNEKQAIAVVKLAISDNPDVNTIRTAYHEIGHVVEKTLLTDKERAILENKYSKGDKDWQENYADGFAKYADEKLNGARPKTLIPEPVRKIFNKILDFFESIGNYLRGQGFKNHTDIFNDVLSGKMADRELNIADDNSERNVRITGISDKVFSDKLWQARKEAKQWAKENLQKKEFINEDTGWKIQINRAGIEKALSGERSLEHIEAIRAIPELLENAVLHESRADRYSDPNIKSIHRFYAPLEISGKLYRAKLTVKETNEGKRFYDHSLTEIEKPAAGRALRTDDTFSGSAPRTGQQASTISLNDLLKDVKTPGGDNLSFSLGQPKEDETIKDKYDSIKSNIRAIGKDIQSIFAPSTMSDAAKVTAGTLRNWLAEYTRKTVISGKALKTYRDHMNTLSSEERVDFINATERGKFQEISPLMRQGVIAFNKMFAGRRDYLCLLI
ncbi:MAG: PBECR2 nuclease fold domain-containing protein [Nitrospirae bacterium YQR-1]